ncbi:hypothetical protein [Methylobacterium sp. NFXW15]|uniref:hypothetical protein n=1 Tax=Methylobacterium sp. NFXW15 TaxID=2819512 RepID=UPI003CE6A65E
MTVRSSCMEHYRSTLTTTAIAVLGLVGAAHVLHPGNYERTHRQARVVAITREVLSTPTIWTDPPRRLHASEPAALMADSSTLLAHRPTIALPAGTRTFPRLPGALVPPVAERQPVDGDPIGDLIHNLELDQQS